MNNKQKKEGLYIKIYTGMCLILFVTTALFSFFKWREYSFARLVLKQDQVLINELKVESADELGGYESYKEDYDALNKEIQDKLVIIFPDSDNYTALTRQMDSYEENLASARNRGIFEVSSIDYQEPITTDDYSVLPFRMTIRSSEENFEKFLHLIETSGSMISGETTTSQGQVRLMTISTIRLNFQTLEDESGPDQEVISFNVLINAYFQKNE